MQKITKILGLSVLGIFLALNGSVLGWCSATNSLLLGTSGCSAISSVEEHDCGDCEHDCPEEVQEDNQSPCNKVFKLELEDFLVVKQLDSQWDDISFDTPKSGWNENRVTLTTYPRFTHTHWVPPPLRHRFCVYRL